MSRGSVSLMFTKIKDTGGVGIGFLLARSFFFFFVSRATRDASAYEKHVPPAIYWASSDPSVLRASGSDSPILPWKVKWLGEPIIFFTCSGKGRSDEIPTFRSQFGTLRLIVDLKRKTSKWNSHFPHHFALFGTGFCVFQSFFKWP